MVDSATLDKIFGEKHLSGDVGVIGEGAREFRYIDGSRILREMGELKDVMDYLVSKGINITPSNGKRRTSPDLTIEKLFECFRIEIDGNLRKPLSEYNPLSIVLVSMNEGLPIVGCRGYTVMDRPYKCKKVKVNGVWRNILDSINSRIEEYIDKNHCYRSLCSDCYSVNYPVESTHQGYRTSLKTAN